MIISIDIGTRNLGYAKYDKTLTDFGVIDLHQFYKGKDYAKMAKALVDTNFFQGATKIIIERQMSSRMKLLACAIRCFFWDITTMISPQTVKKHFKSSTKKHSTNKKIAKQIVITKLNKTQLQKFNSLKKKDDAADAILQLLYYINSINSI